MICTALLKFVLVVYYFIPIPGIGGTGTMRQNRLGPVPLPKKKVVEKEFERGDYSEVFTDDMNVVVWKDNKPVYMASNIMKVIVSTHCSRAVQIVCILQ